MGRQETFEGSQAPTTGHTNADDRTNEAERLPFVIAGMSDQHGFLSHEAPECDILCIVGDIMPLYSSAEDWKQWQELAWIEQKYVRWLKRQKFKHCLIVWGNHDICAMSPDTRPLVNAALEAIPGVQILDHDIPSTVINGVRFSGYPYTPTIQQRNWAFSLPRGDERVSMGLEHYIHPETDVLLSHGPPQGKLEIEDDLCQDCGASPDKVRGGYTCGSYFDTTDDSWPWVTCRGGQDV